MITEEYIAEMEDILFEAIEKKDRKLIHRFLKSYVDYYHRDMSNVAHSIELLAQQMSSFQREMNAHFELIDKRFEAVDKRFEAVDKRFEAIQREMNARFEATDKRFEAMDKRFNTLTWFIGASFTFISVLIVISNYIVHVMK